MARSLRDSLLQKARPVKGQSKNAGKVKGWSIGEMECWSIGVMEK